MVGGLAVEPLCEETRHRRQQFAVAGDGPEREALRVAVHHHGAVLHVHHTRGQMQAALHAVLGQHDRGAGVLAQAPDRRQQLLGAHRVQLRRGLVEQQQMRLHGDDGGESDLLQLAAGERLERGAAQVREAEAHERLFHEAGDGAALDPLVLEAEGDLALDGGHHGLVLGILEHQTDTS